RDSAIAAQPWRISGARRIPAKQPSLGGYAARDGVASHTLFARARHLRPILHLQAGDQPVGPTLGPEDRRLAFLDIEPILAERIDDVGLVGDEDVVLFLRGHPRQHLA